MEDLVRPCEQIATDKAKQSVEKGEYQQHLIDSQISSGKADLDNDAKVRLVWLFVGIFILSKISVVGSQRR